MLRKSLLVIAFISLGSIIAWGFTTSRTATGASNTPAVEASLVPSSLPAVQNAQCQQPTIKIKDVTLQGTRPKIGAAQVTFEVANVNPCFKIRDVVIKVTFTNANGDAVTREQTFTNVNNGANTVSVPLSSASNLLAVFKLGTPVNQITFARVNAVPISQVLTGTDQVTGSF